MLSTIGIKVYLADWQIVAQKTGTGVNDVNKQSISGGKSLGHIFEAKKWQGRIKTYKIEI